VIETAHRYLFTGMDNYRIPVVIDYCQFLSIGMDKYVLSSVIIDCYSVAVECRVNTKVTRCTMDSWLAHTVLCTGSLLWVADYCDGAI
jgi:hypothetical protein